MTTPSPLRRSAVLVALLGTVAAGAQGASTESRFTKLTSDTLVSSTGYQTVLSTSITLLQPKGVLVVADGRLYPAGRARMPDLGIRIDGSLADSSQAILDWTGTVSGAAVQHSFDAIAYRQLGAGTHTIQLVARNHPARGSGRFRVGADSALSVMVDPAPHVLVSKLGADSQNIDLATNQPPGIVIREGDPRPMVTLGRNRPWVSSPTPVASLYSGRAYVACNTAYPNNTPGSTNSEGDAAWGLQLSNSSCVENSQSSWSVNDLWRGAEKHANLYGHGYHTVTGGTSIEFNAGELVFNDSVNNFENAVCYRVGANSQMISLYGMGISGSAPVDFTGCRTYRFRCIGTSMGSSGCPTVGQEVVLATKTIHIPSGHNGVVFFSAKTRIQGDPSDAGGNTFLYLKIDGVQRGSFGVQQLVHPQGASSRTLTASYLSADGPQSARLAPGNHTVQVVAKAQGSFRHVSVTKDLPLVYFD